MKNQQFLITISIDEFNNLHDSGRLRVDGNRIVSLQGDMTHPIVIDLLMAKLPEFMERDEHNVLTLLFRTSSGTDYCLATHANRMDIRFTLRAEDCLQVIPTTSQAKLILESRFSGRVFLSDPVFEKYFEEDFKLRHYERSLRGANALVSTLLQFENYQVPMEMLKLCEQYVDDVNGLFGKLINYQRRDPMPKEPISGLRDLGRFLSDTLPDRKPNDPLLILGEWLKMRKDSLTGFHSVYTDQSLHKVLDTLTLEFHLPVHASSIAIFFYWRDLALRAGGLDLLALEADCRQLAGCVVGSRIVDATWLLGFSAGLETFASDFYSRLQTGHPFGGGKCVGEKVTLLWPDSSVPNQNSLQSLALGQNQNVEQQTSQYEVDKSEISNATVSETNNESQKIEVADPGVSPVQESAAIKPTKKTAKKAAKKTARSKADQKPLPIEDSLFDQRDSN
jgi:hypothetical protein